MYAPGTTTTSNGQKTSRGGMIAAVVAVHIALVYAISASMGIVPIPKLSEPAQVVFIPEEVKPEPEEPIVEPKIADIAPAETPVPELEIEEPIAPPAEVEMPPSETAIAATPAPAGAPAQELKTRQRVEPTYPPTSRRLGEEGTVRVKVLVDERGKPQQVEVAKSSGFPKLDDAAVQAVRKWRFHAATDGQNAITAWTQVAVSFRLT